MAETRFRTFLVCAPGFEHALRNEVLTLNSRLPPLLQPSVQFTRMHIDGGGIECWATREGLWALCHLSRIAEQVRVRIGSPFVATDFRGFRAGASKLPLVSLYARDDAKPLTASVKATCIKSKLFHSGAVEERVWQTLIAKYAAQLVNAPDTSQFKFQERQHQDREEDDEEDDQSKKKDNAKFSAFASKSSKSSKPDSKPTSKTPSSSAEESVESSTSKPASTSSIPEIILAAASTAAASVGAAAAAHMSLSVRLERDEVRVSVDAGGGQLYRRGYRTHVLSERSLRETLAAACLQLALPPRLLFATKPVAESIGSSSNEMVSSTAMSSTSSNQTSSSSLISEQGSSASSSSTPAASGQTVPECWSLWDPFCGSGVFPIEAALYFSRSPNFLNLFASTRPEENADENQKSSQSSVETTSLATSSSSTSSSSKKSISSGHHFSFQDWQSFDKYAYRKLTRAFNFDYQGRRNILQQICSADEKSVGESEAKRLSILSTPALPLLKWTVHGSDRNPRALAAARHNWSLAQRGSLFDAHWLAGDAFSPTLHQQIPSAMIVTHLPYGDHDNDPQEEAQTRRLYERFGQLLRARHAAGALSWPKTLLARALSKKSRKAKKSSSIESSVASSSSSSSLTNADASSSSSASASSPSPIPTTAVDPTSIDPLSGLPVFVVVRQAHWLQAATQGSGSRSGSASSESGGGGCNWRVLTTFNNRGTSVTLMQLQSIDM